MAVDVTLIEYRARRAIEALSQHARVVGAYLFGSHVEGNADQWSDIDIAAFIEDLGTWDMERVADTSFQVQKEVGNDVELHFFPARALARPERASFAAYVIQHGRPIPLEERGTASGAEAAVRSGGTGDTSDGHDA